jgi:hypothetical protein
MLANHFIFQCDNWHFADGNRQQDLSSAYQHLLLPDLFPYSIAFGCMYIIPFGIMKSLSRGIKWAEVDSFHCMSSIEAKVIYRKHKS